MSGLLEGRVAIVTGASRGDAGAEVPVELFVSLTVERGMDTDVVGGDDAEALRRFAGEVAPRVRAGVAAAR